MINITTTRTPKARCPKCGSPNDSMTNIAGKTPRPGRAVCVCLYCGQVSTLRPDWSLRPATPEEITELDEWRREDPLIDLQLKAAEQIRGRSAKLASTS